jgi:uncharacterized LabA/DUF88 family protein
MPPIPPREKGGSNNISIVIDKPDPQLEPTHRAIVFVDYQNVYRSARDAYGLHGEDNLLGNVRPYSLGRQMMRGGGLTLAQVRVYTGIHTPQRKPKLHGMMQRRISAWIASNPDKIEVFPRPVRYGGAGPREKGVDVEIAIDFVRLALDDAYDVGILLSADTDLVPALQFVADRYPAKRLITVGYAPDTGCQAPAPLDLPRGTVERRYMTRRDFERVRDDTDYYLPTSDRSAEIDQQRWTRVMRRMQDQ